MMNLHRFSASTTPQSPPTVSSQMSTLAQFNIAVEEKRYKSKFSRRNGEVKRLWMCWLTYTCQTLYIYLTYDLFLLPIENMTGFQQLY